MASSVITENLKRGETDDASSFAASLVPHAYSNNCEGTYQETCPRCVLDRTLTYYTTYGDSNYYGVVKDGTTYMMGLTRFPTPAGQSVATYCANYFQFRPGSNGMQLTVNDTQGLTELNSGVVYQTTGRQEGALPRKIKELYANTDYRANPRAEVVRQLCTAAVGDPEDAYHANVTLARMLVSQGSLLSTEPTQ